MSELEGQKQKPTMDRAMTKEHSFVAGDYSDRDVYASSRTQERALNSAIVRAEISESFEEYLEIFEAFYADDIEVSSETAEEPIRGKDRVRSLLATFLVPLHVMAEVAGLSVSIRQTAIPGDVAGETHCVDARLGRRVRQDVHGDLAGPPQMERLAGSVRASL
jgi:hypothetical protein